MLILEWTKLTGRHWQARQGDRVLADVKASHQGAGTRWSFRGLVRGGSITRPAAQVAVEVALFRLLGPQPWTDRRIDEVKSWSIASRS